MGRNLMPNSPIHTGIWSSLLIQIQSMVSQPLWAYLYSCPVVSRRRCFFVVMHHLWLLHSFCSCLLQWSLNLAGRSVVSMQFSLAQSILQSLPLSMTSLWASVLNTVYRKQSFSDEKWEVHGYSDRPLGVSSNAVSTEQNSRSRYSTTVYDLSGYRFLTQY